MIAPSELIAAIQSGRALIICGGGVSMTATRNQAPSWKRLIESAIDAACVQPDPDSGWTREMANDCRAVLSSATSMNTILEQLNKVQDALGGINSATYRAWLGTTVGHLTVLDPSIITAIERLTATGSKIATSNYDTLIAQHIVGAEPISCLYPRMIDDFLNDRRRGVWHLHGCYDQPQSIVFSANDYRRIRNDDLAQFLQRLSAKSLTLVFVGCSASGLTDDNIGHLLKWFGDNWSAGGKAHFALCREKDERERWPNSVQPVVFGVDYPELSGFLRALAPRPPLALFPADPMMVGRAQRRRELVEEILKGTSPIIIPGGPGMGKTTLALSAAHHPTVAAKYSNRRVFVSLDGASDGIAMLSALAHSLGLPAFGSPSDSIAAIRMRAASGMLAVLDNLETPWQRDPDTTEELIRQLSVPGLVLVLTIRGKTPRIGHCLEDVTRIADNNEAAEIFLRSAGGKRRRLASDPDLMSLVLALEGHPLSLRLLGSASQGFGDLVSLRRRWEAEKANLLRDGPDENRLTSTRASLRASLASPLLTEAGKRLLGLLALLPAGLQRDDADALLPGTGHDAAGNLVSLQLVNELDGRLSMLAPLREATLLEALAENADRFRLVEHFLKIARDAGKAGRSTWSNVRERVTREAGNLDAACLLALDGVHSNLLEALRGVARFYRFTTMGSVASLENAARFFELDNQMAEAAACLMSLGAVAVRRSDGDRAEKYFHQAMPMFRRAGSTEGEANCIQGIALIQFDRALYPESEASYHKAMSLYVQIGNLQGKANCVRGLGDIARKCHTHDVARQAYEEAIALYRLVGDGLGEAICSKSLGELSLDMHELAPAESAFRRAIPLFHEFGDGLREAECLQGLGDICEKENQSRRAADEWQAALALFVDIGYPLQIGHAHLRLSRVANTPEARRSHEAAGRSAWLSIHRQDLIQQYLA